MLDFLVGLSIDSVWIALLLLVALFGLRAIATVRERLPLRQALLVLLVPFALGYALLLPRKTRLSRLYGIVVALTVLFALLGSFWVFYTRFA